MWFRRSFGGLSFDFRVIRFVRRFRVEDFFDGLGHYVVVFRCREPDVDMHGERKKLYEWNMDDGMVVRNGYIVCSHNFVVLNFLCSRHYVWRAEAA